MGTLNRVGLAVLAAAALLLAAAPGQARAAVSGGCSVTGTSTGAGPIDIGSTDVWHVRTTDRISVSASAPTPQTNVGAGIYAFGFLIPVGSATSDGSTTIDTDLFDVSTIALLGRTFVLSGTSSGPQGGCEATIQLVVEDASPVANILGGGAAGAALIGILMLAANLRRPDRIGSLLAGLVGLGLIGGATSVLLQQTSGIGLPGAGIEPLAWVSSVVPPTAVALDPTVLAEAAALSLALVLLMPFPAELFNRTFEANIGRIRAAVGRLPLLRSRANRGLDVEHRPVAIAAVLLIAALLYGLLDPAFPAAAGSLAMFVGTVAALFGVAWVAGLPRRALNRALTGDRGRLRAAPESIVVVAICVLVSRLADFQPGYLYGLLLGFTFSTTIEERAEGRALALGAAWMLGLAIVAWLSLGAMLTPGIEPSIAVAIARSVFAAFVVAGIEGIVFGLIPLRFLHGRPIYRWSRARWAGLYALGAFGFFWIILNPANGFLEAAGKTPFATAVGLFVGFGLVSILFWSYFRIRPTPVPTGTAGPTIAA